MTKKIILALVFFSFSSIAQKLPNYKNAKLSPEKRTLDLLKRMTVEEKVGQLLCPMGWEMYQKVGNTVNYSSKFKDLIDNQHIGSFWAVYRADPWTQKTLENGLNPKLAAEVGNALQKYVIENTRLGIPLFLAEESPHGHMAIGTTVFPTGIGQASTWNPDLIELASAAMAKEVRLQGGHISYGPVMDLSRDPRWSRVEESFGEDPILTAFIGSAVVKGAGAGKLNQKYAVISTLKHFIAYGIPEGGHNGNTAIIGERELHENFFPPFKKAIEAGALSVMTAYNSINGIPCTSNNFLYNDLLKKQWSFKGFVVSDLFSINGLSGTHKVAHNLQESGELSLKAGVDMDLGASAFANLKKSLDEKKITIQQLDEAVSRILKLKFEMGLFENPYVDPQLAQIEVRNTSHINLAKKVAQESIVLLKNNILPLSKSTQNIAVIGPNADNIYNQLGDYTAPQEETNVITVYKGIKNHFKNANVNYIKGVAIRDTANTNIEEALSLSKKSDVIIAVVGGSSARDFKTEYIETGAAISTNQSIQDMESGEGFDRSSLNLMGKQLDLLKALKETGKPLIVIYIQGRPLEMNWAKENADALLTAWYPGQEGGNAIAEILSGDYNPSGKLPISVPKNVGQLPVYYNKKNPKPHNYIEIDAAPAYPFGYGLSYSTFEYEDLKVEQTSNTNFDVKFKIKNSGKYDGQEVAQLYINDEVASFVQAQKQLKQFQKIHLKAGETKELTFKITAEDLSIISHNMKPIVEPGAFKILIGTSSEEIRLQEKIYVK